MRSLSASRALVASSSSRSGGFFSSGAGDGNALALPARQPHAALAQEGGVALGQGLQKIVGKGLLGGGDDFSVCGVGATIADVVQRAG